MQFAISNFQFAILALAVCPGAITAAQWTAPVNTQYGVVPGPPSRPVQASRPQSWPGTEVRPKQWAPQNWSPPGRGPAGEHLPQAEMKPCEGAQIIARVGSDVILAGEVMPGVDELIAANKDRIPADQLEKQRELLIRQRLNSYIETKLIYQDARRSIPEENFPQVEKSLKKHFEQVELKDLMKRAKVDTRQQLEEKLRSMGSSLQQRRRAFVQRTLAEQWIRQKAKLDGEITCDQMLDYYNNHLSEFDRPARARWEELMVRFSKHPGKAEAHALIAHMGNQVLAGAALAQVARVGSDGATASEGGQRDWTTKGSLVSEVFDRALFALPVGRLSPILESDRGFYIIRVTEREDAHRVPFLEAQVEIEKKIRRQRTRKEMQTYLARLKDTIPVWTVFDDQPADQQLSNRPGRPRR